MPQTIQIKVLFWQNSYLAIYNLILKKNPITINNYDDTKKKKETLLGQVVASSACTKRNNINDNKAPGYSQHPVHS